MLAGASAGFGARCQDAETAACWAAPSIAVRAARLARRIGPVGYLASELADELPAVTAGLRAELGSRDGPRP